MAQSHRKDRLRDADRIARGRKKLFPGCYTGRSIQAPMRRLAAPEQEYPRTLHVCWHQVPARTPVSEAELRLECFLSRIWSSNANAMSVASRSYGRIAHRIRRLRLAVEVSLVVVETHSRDCREQDSRHRVWRSCCARNDETCQKISNQPARKTYDDLHDRSHNDCNATKRKMFSTGPGDGSIPV